MRATRRKAGWTVAIAVILGAAVILPSMIALGWSVLAVVLDLLG